MPRQPPRLARWSRRLAATRSLTAARPRACLADRFSAEIEARIQVGLAARVRSEPAV